MKSLKIILTAVLCVITAFSVFKYIVTQNEKKILLASIKQIEQQVASLEKDKQGLQKTIEQGKEVQMQLTEQNKGLTEDLKAVEDKLAKSSSDLSQAQKTIDELNLQVGFLKDERDNMAIKLADMSQEKDALKTKVSSVKELKKAIRKIKLQLRAPSHEIPKKEKARIINVTDGNRGFVMKNGTPTYTPKIKIKVEPALKE